MWVRLPNKSKSNSCSETYSVGGYMVRKNMRVPGEILPTCGAILQGMAPTRFVAGSQMNP